MPGTSLTAILLVFLLTLPACIRTSPSLVDDTDDSTLISVKSARKLLAASSGLAIDTRAAEDYAAGHLPGAFSIPACRKTQGLLPLPEDHDTLLILYCGWPGCSGTTPVAAGVNNAGYSRLRILEGGAEAWLQAGYPLEATDDFILSNIPLVIDLRPADKHDLSRIPGSIAIQPNTLTDRLENISRRTPVVLYGESTSQSVESTVALVKAGFTRIATVEGGFRGWKQRGNTVESGQTGNETIRERQAVKGISPADFRKAVQDGKGTVLLDVRTKEETTAGMFFRAVNIPLEELAGRMNELPRQKKILVYSSGGARAKLASDLLGSKGYKAFPLRAEIRCRESGCEVLN